MTTSAEPALLTFYRATGRDRQGRLLAEIQRWPDDRLEYTHDFIQWLFPLRERSQFNSDAPLLDDAAIAAFQTEPGLRAALRASLACMLTFYGLEWDGGAVRKAARYEERAREWLTPGNHNHLRITRILKSLMALGLEAEARSFFSCLVEIYEKERGRISARTFEFWSSAVKS